MPILDSYVARYLHDLEPRRGGVMLEIEQAAKRGKMPCLPWATARFIAALVRARDPERILEVGTGFGYTTLHMAEALGRGRIATVERDPDRAKQARSFFGRAGVAERIQVVEGNLAAALEDLDGPFDLVLIDVARFEAAASLKLVEPLLAPRAVALIPATLIWGLIGADYEEAPWASDMQVFLVSMARALNAELVSTGGWLGVVLPVGGGLVLAVRR